MANENSTGTGYKSAPKDTSAFALNVLKEKYGESFQYLGPWGSSMGGTQEFLASCDSLPGQRILVGVENYKDADTRSVSDNYLACRYAQETEDYLRRCAEETIGSARVFYSPAMLTLSPSLPADLSFERFLAESGVYLGAIIAVKASEFQNEEQARALIRKIADSGVECNLNIIALPDEVFDTLSEEEIGSRIRTANYVRFARASCRDGAVELKYKEGAA